MKSQFTKRLVLALALLVFFGVALIGFLANASPSRPLSTEATGAWLTADETEVETAILLILEANPKHRLNRDDAARKTLAAEIVAVANREGVPPLLATTIIFFESSFNEKVVGARGELGLMQVAKGNVAHYRCDMTTTATQIECGTRMLREAYDVCGRTWAGALTRYATTTGTCRSDMPSVTGSVNLRLRKWQRVSIFVGAHLYEQGAEE
jgi:soluble lytic murein transglycosylase-like protein